MSKTLATRTRRSFSGNWQPASGAADVKRKWPGIAVIAFALVMFVAVADAQQTTQVPRIGYATGSSRSAISGRIVAFQQGLRELGYVEGKNIVIEGRFADGKRDRVPALVAELVGLKVNVIVSGGSSSTRAAKEAVSDATGTFCHLKFPAIREESLFWDRPALKDVSEGDIIDFYGPCDHDPLGKEEIQRQKADLLRERRRAHGSD